MIELKKTSATLNENYTFADDNTTGNVTAVSDQITGEKVSMNGSVYEKDAEGKQGAYIGNFNGQMVNGVMKYTTSQMTRQQYNIVMQLTEELENQFVNK